MEENKIERCLFCAGERLRQFHEVARCLDCGANMEYLDNTWKLINHKNKHTAAAPKKKVSQKSRIQKQFKRWDYLVTSFGWKFTVNYCQSSEDMPDGLSDNCLAVTYADFKYLKAKIYFNLRKAADEADEWIEEAVIHELTHLLLSPMQDDNGEQNTEYCVTSISRLFKGLRNASKN